jgi:hypothetical protein
MSAARDGAFSLEALLAALPDQRERLRPYIDKAHAYSAECGCALGGAFMVAATGALIPYGMLLHGFAGRGVVISVLEAVGFVFAATIIGKFVGVGIARVRLALLCRRLRALYPGEGA